MSIERLSGQGYAPIPQSMSNTDTEEEDERLTLPNVNIHDDNKMHDVNTVQGNGWCNNPNEARNFEKESTDNQGGYRYCGDDVPIIIPDLANQDDFWKRKDMTTLRRCCTIFSILFCFFAFYAFLYLLPCNNTKICPPVEQKQPVITLDKTLDGVELHGPITIVHGTPYSLIFLLRGQFYGINNTSTTTSREIPSDGGGVLSMQGNTGAILWWIPLKQLPINVDCASFGRDGSGSPDCIVSGNNLMVRIDPISGTIYWTEHEHLDSRIPLHVSDVDSDGIDDMVAIKDYGTTGSAIVLISGKTGKILNGIVVSDCADYDKDFLRITGFDSMDTISYSCTGKDTKQMVNLTLSLSSLVQASHLDWPRSEDNSNSIRGRGTRYPTNMYENIENYALTLTPYYRLSVENFGLCPSDTCRVSVNVTLQKSETDKSRVIWSHSSNNSYAMRPAIYSINKTGYVTGFAIKFWQWNNEKDKTLDDTEKIVERHVTERVLMVFVNYTNVHVMDASQSEIVQLCKLDDCQPSLSLQTRSIAIADLGGDGTWELINYQSTYNTETPRVLTSRVQIVKLDTVVSQLTQYSVN